MEYNKEAEKNPANLKPEDDCIEKHGKHFTCLFSFPSTE